MRRSLTGLAAIALASTALASNALAEPDARAIAANPHGTFFARQVASVAIRALEPNRRPAIPAMRIEPSVADHLAPPAWKWTLGDRSIERGALADTIDLVHRRTGGLEIVLGSTDPTLGWAGAPEVVELDQRRWNALFDPVAKYSLGRVSMFANAGVATGQPRSSVNARLGAWTVYGIAAPF